jgi:hypothetical protein
MDDDAQCWKERQAEPNAHPYALPIENEIVSLGLNGSYIRQENLRKLDRGKGRIVLHT